LTGTAALALSIERGAWLVKATSPD